MSSCTDDSRQVNSASPPITAIRADSVGQRLGALVSDDGTEVGFRVYSSGATRIEAWIYAEAIGGAEVLRYELTLDPDTRIFSRTVEMQELVAATDGAIFYGYRAWGPNWTYDAGWQPGSDAGFVSDVDGERNRFNPNKLLLDPYALEVSHDPLHEDNIGADVYASGPDRRNLDSAPVAPKGIVLAAEPVDLSSAPTRPLRDEVIYEVNVRGLTKNDDSIPASLRGTYAGAALKAAYLRELGVTAVEFLPVQETQNDTNDLADGTNGDNYWGYATLAWFAPDRRYASDKSPGGPTREFREMVQAMHAEGLKVYIDVVYNHTGEGGLWDNTGDVASLLSWRGLDNASYYEGVDAQDGPITDPKNYWDNNGVGPNFSAAETVVRNQIIDSLSYWNRALGVDGFRFDLASVLGNACKSGCFSFDKLDPNNVLNRAVVELPARTDDGGAGVDLIAEPWAIGDGTFQLGNFPWGWAEWNGDYRDTIRSDQNALGVDAITPAQLATRIAGSSDLFQDDGRKPWHSVNFLVAHDGFSHADLYSCNAANNNQDWPYGPSDGGHDHNISWDQGGDPTLQRQAARTGLAILALSAGVPMITGGDEFLRSQRCNNNAYNLDSVGNWLDWQAAAEQDAFQSFSRRLLNFRNAHPALRPADFYDGADHNDNGLSDLTWYTASGNIAGGAYFDDADQHFLAWRFDGTEAGDPSPSIYVAYNGWSGVVTATLPSPLAGGSWARVADTAAWMEGQDNFVDEGSAEVFGGTTYDLAARSLLILVEQ